MTTFTSTKVSGLIASPQTIIARGVNAAVSVTVKGTEALATTDIDASDIILLCHLPWEAKVHSIVLFNDDLDSHGTPTITADVGLYKMTQAGTVTALDIDAYASLVTTLQAANTSGVEMAFEARDINKILQTVIVDAALTSKPDDGFAILGLTIGTGAATAVAGDISYVVEYTMP
jgi:hypothetical protein